MENRISPSNLGEKIPLVGRKAELDALKRKLFSRGDSHMVYFKALGGIGKTRILQELVEVVDQAGAGYKDTGIIDLYHTDNHSTSDLERVIVERMDPHRKYFREYRVQRKRYTDARELGSSPESLEPMREELARTFIKEWAQLANEHRKLVIILDTIELLQYESSIVEEKAGLDTLDARIKPWLLSVLPQLSNLLVVFAGRPKTASRGQTVDHQQRLEQQMRQAFARWGKDGVEIRELKGLTLVESREFINKLGDGKQEIPEDLLPVVRHLTGGAPIFLHLIVDLSRRLVPYYQGLKTWFEQHKDLVDLPEDDPRLAEARREIKVSIVKGIFDRGEDLGVYLERIAMIPKGINVDILFAALGLPRQDALDLIAALENLSFVKRFEELSSEPALLGDRLFLHDEMYQLFRLAGVVPDLPVTERQIANMLVYNYYTPQIERLEGILRTLPAEKREEDRRRYEKLQVERLYYLLVQDPVKGFAEYKRLTDEANRRRFVGYSMRLHDEFLRFYNLDERRKRFDKAGIPHEQVVRESAEMWVERFHWWGQYSRVIEFVKRILAAPQELHIDPDVHTDLLGNICALYGRAKAMTSGFDLDTAALLQNWLRCQPDLTAAAPAQKLACARLSASLGYLYDQGGQSSEAARYYVKAQEAFDSLAMHQDELAMLLNNLSYGYAHEGRFDTALPLVHRARQLNQAYGTERSTGLTLSTMASIELLRGNYPDAIRYGQKADDTFNMTNDTWGCALAQETIAHALRKMAKSAINQNWDLDEALKHLDEAHQAMGQAIKLAEEAGYLTMLGMLYAGMGKIYREQGLLAKKGYGKEKPSELFYESEKYFEKALITIRQEGKANPAQAVFREAETLTDLAETQFFADYPSREILSSLEHAERVVGKHHLITADNDLSGVERGDHLFLPLGMVERLRGEMEMDQHQTEGGLQHLYLAYLYFDLFSKADTSWKQSIINYLYAALQNRSLDERRELIAGLNDCAASSYARYEPSGFIETMQRLLG